MSSKARSTICSAARHFSVAEAVELFQEIAIGLAHAHGKGVVHCDLKPANVLLDQDGKPRLADFGQSRLSHEQKPALGTLFYMAPEQADLQAVPDVRWDVYALGAMLYTLLVGTPPHRNDDTVANIDAANELEERLARYRHAIRAAPPPSEHRRITWHRPALAEIIDRCLAVNPNRSLCQRAGGARCAGRPQAQSQPTAADGHRLCRAAARFYS